MLRLLRVLWTGRWELPPYEPPHRHEWETVKEVRLQDNWEGVGTRFVLRCKSCGEIKHYDCI